MIWGRVDGKTFLAQDRGNWNNESNKLQMMLEIANLSNTIFKMLYPFMFDWHVN